MDAARYDFTYDTYGNLSSALMPQNLNGQRLRFTYQYDINVHTYPIRVDNVSLGFFSSASYDLKFGKPTRTVDINGNEMRYQYDHMGRNTVILAPYEIDAGQTYTIRMEYHPKNYGSLSISCSGGQSYACTYHYDRQHPGSPIRTTVIADGLGRTVEQYHPFKEDTALFATYNPYYSSGTHTAMKYDIMDRQTYVKPPLNLVTTISYDFDTCYGKQCLRTTVTDPKGNKVRTLAGTLGQQLKQVAPMNTVTWFEYDGLGRLRKSTDPDNNGATVSFVYDTPTAQVYTGVMDSLIGQSTNLDDQVTP